MYLNYVYFAFLIIFAIQYLVFIDLIYITIIAGMFFLLDLIKKIVNPEKPLYILKLTFFILITGIFWIYHIYVISNFYSSGKFVGQQYSYTIDIDLINNSKQSMKVDFIVEDSTGSLKTYYTNGINLKNMNALTQITEIKTGSKSTFKLMIAESSNIIIRDLGTNYRRSIKLYAAKEKTRIYSSDFDNTPTYFNINKTEEFLLLIQCLVALIGSIYHLTRLPENKLLKIPLLLLLFSIFIVSSYNLYIFVIIIGSI